MSLEIAISMRDVRIPEYSDDRDALSRDWYPFLSKCRLKPLLVPNLGKSVREYLEGKKLDGILLSGGNNISPLLCSAEEGETVGDTSEIRDETEIALIDLAVEKKIPLLGVCRGTQVINTYFGGKITFYFKNKNADALAHAGTKHDVRLSDQKMIGIAGSDAMIVNSFHNHAFTEKQVGKGLRIAATAPDGSVESVIHETFRIAGIMWHPERTNPSHEFDMEFVKEFFGAERL